MDDGLHSLWDRVRRDWDTAGLTLATIARQNGLSVAALLAHARVNKWPDRPIAMDRLILIGRLLGVLELQIDNLEKTEMTTTGDKEAAVLGRLTANLGRLISLANTEARGTRTEEETAEMRDIRNRLAARINALTKK